MKKLTVSILIMLFAVFISTPTFAQSLNRPDKPTLEDRQEERDAQKEARTEAKDEKTAERDARLEEKKTEIEEKKLENQAQRCERATERLNQKYTDYGQLKKQQSTMYFNFVNKLEETADKLDAKGFDTTALREDITELGLLIDAYTGAYDAFLASLQTMQNNCDEDPQSYRGMLSEIRSLLTDARNARKEIVDFYAHDIRKTIADLRQQAADMYEEEEALDDEEDTEEGTSIGGIEEEDNTDTDTTEDESTEEDTGGEQTDTGTEEEIVDESEVTNE